MEHEDQLRQALAAMLMLPPADLQASTSLGSLDNSLGEAKLRVAVRRLGLRLPAGARPASFGDLCRLLTGNGAVAPVAKTQTGFAPILNTHSGGPSVGLDIQDIASLPVATDYWEDAFYSSTFAKSEIAYAVMDAEPRMHFAGFWCAKEALRKCDPSFAEVEPTATVVAHEAGGRPYLLWNGPSGEIRLPHALSISHTTAIAMAVVMTIAVPSTAGPAL